MILRVALLSLVLVAVACANTPPQAVAPPVQSARAAPDGAAPAAPTPAPRRLLAGSIRVFDGSGRETHLDALLDDVARADAVFLGETHLDDATHLTEEEILRGLIERTGGEVVLSLEAFERDVQAHVDAYLAGETDEAKFLNRSRPWGNYRTAFRPLIELAKAEGIPVIAANFPAPLRFKVRGQKERWEALTPEERRFTPRELFPNSAAYWERVDRATRGHTGARDDRTPQERLYDGQCLWDNAMGEAVADAIAAYPDRVVLHVVGGFHVRDRDGTVAQAARRAPGADLRVISVWPQFDLAAARAGEGLTQAPGDYTVLTAARASGLDEGRWAVEVGADLRYKIRVPDDATDEEPAPLLVWLGDDGARDDDGLRYWRLALGDAAAVVSVDPLLLSEEEDLSLGGRWFWTDTFTSDVSRAERGIERLVEYVTRRFPVDGERVVVAGRGTGATVVLWAAMYTGSLDGVLIAAQPRRTGRLQMAGLPDEKSSVARLLGITAADRADDLRGLLADYFDMGIPTEIAIAPDGSSGLLSQIESAVRDALVLAQQPETAPTADPAPQGKGRKLVRLGVDTPTASRWADLFVRSSLARGAPVELAAPGGEGELLDIGGIFSVADAARPGVLPAAPGPFGGSTVVVVPAAADDALREQWKRLAEDDPLAGRSRFLRLVLAFEDGSPSLPEALAGLKAAGRKNVMIVPARFCAGGDEMRALRRAAGDVLEGMTVHWLPGLGLGLATRQ